MNEPNKPRFTPVILPADLDVKRGTGQAFQGSIPTDQQFREPRGEADDEIDLLQLFGVLWRGKWIIMLCSLLAMTLGGYYAFEVAVPKYSATARLALQARDQQVVDLESVMSGVSTEQAAINTELEVIRSRGLLERLATELNLVEDPEFNTSLRTSSPYSLGEVVKRFAAWLSITLPEDPPPSGEEIQNNVVDNLREALGVSSQRNTYLFDIRATTESPARSAEIANKLAAIYLDDQIRIKFEATEYAINWLSKRVTDLEVDLKKEEDAIKDLRADTELVSLEALEALNLRSKDVRERLAIAQANVVTSQMRAERMAALATTRDVDAILAEVEDSVLIGLANETKAGDLNANIRFFARFDELVEREASNTNRMVLQRNALQASNVVLLENLDAQNADLSQLNQLVREADATRVLYETFLTRLKETSVQIGLQQADSRILSRAIPSKLVEPRKSLILALSLVLGGMLGIGIVLLRQYLHDGIRTAEELELLTGQTIIGQIPKMPIRRRNSLVNYLKDKPTSAGAEAIRNLRTSVLLSNIDNPPKIIMSTSSIPGLIPRVLQNDSAMDFGYRLRC